MTPGPRNPRPRPVTSATSPRHLRRDPAMHLRVYVCIKVRTRTSSDKVWDFESLAIQFAVCLSRVVRESITLVETFLDFGVSG